VTYTDQASDLASSSSAVVSVNVLASALVPILTPSSSRIPLSQGVLTLSAAASYDPDFQTSDGGETEDSDQALEFLWTCERRLIGGDHGEPRDCFSGANSEISTTDPELSYVLSSEDGLDLDELVFAVNVTKDQRHIQVQGVFTFALTEIPQVKELQ